MPIQDYVDFLRGLKGQKVIVSAIVGPDATTEEGNPISFVRGTPDDPQCDPGSPEYDPGQGLSEACCPQGRCVGKVRHTCESDYGKAVAGSRYIRQARAIEGSEVKSLYESDFGAPLERVRDPLVPAIARALCLQTGPLCLHDGQPCTTEEQRAAQANYELEIACSGASCSGVGGRLLLGFGDCATGAAFEPNAPLPADAALKVR